MPRIPPKDLFILVLVVFSIVLSEAIVWKAMSDPTVKKQEAEVIKIKSEIR